MEAHRQWLDQELGVGPGWKRHRAVVDEVRYAGTRKVTTILDHLYDGASVYLDRKRALYDRLTR